MKLSLDSLKGIDWKRVGVDHGEKIAVGLVGLTVLLIVGLGTRWSVYDAKNPQELQQTVDAKRQALHQATWPDEEKRQHPASYQVGLVVAREQGPVKLDPYDYPLGHAMHSVLVKQQQRYEEPNWLALDFGEVFPTAQRPLEFGGGRALFETGNPQAFGAEGMLAGEGIDGEGGAAQAPLDVNDPFRNANPGGLNGENAFGPGPGGEAPGGPGPGGPGPGGPGPRRRGAGGGSHDAPGGPMGVDGFAPGMEEAPGMGPGMGPEGMTPAYPVVEGKSYRYASIRFLFPWKQQVDAIAAARQNKDAAEYAKILALFATIDFEIQRQEAQPGPQPWSDKDEDWQTLSREMANQVLGEVAGFEVDIVDAADVDPVITMPLPARLDRRWLGVEAGHSKLKTLTGEEMENQRLLAEALLEKQQKLDMPDNVVERKGFYGAQVDVSDARQSLYGDARARGSFMKGMAGDEGMPGQFDSLENSLARIPEYLLFRYFDFDVRPGVAYRYRARLTLTNPNFDTPLQLVSRPEIAQGKTRTTPWSRPTPPTIIPRDVEVFLADVTSERGEPRAAMKVVQWLPEVGTLVEQTLPIAPGARIADRAAADVVEPGVTLEERQVAFAAPALVVDTETGPVPVDNRAFHADLSLPPTANGQIDVVEQTLIVNESGELEVLTPYTDETRKKSVEDYVQNMLAYFDFLRPVEAATDPMTMGPGEGLDFLPEGGEGEGMSGSPPPRRGRYSRPRNPLGRRGGSSSAAGGHGGGPGGSPGGRGGSPGGP